MKINYHRKAPKRRSPVPPPGVRHTDKKSEQSKKACRSTEEHAFEDWGYPHVQSEPKKGW